MNKTLKWTGLGLLGLLFLFKLINDGKLGETVLSISIALAAMAVFDIRSAVIRICENSNRQRELLEEMAKQSTRIENSLDRAHKAA